MAAKNLALRAVLRALEYSWRYLVKGLRGRTVLKQWANRYHNRSRELELEAIKRFRGRTPLLSPQCRVVREYYGGETLLCVDFAACPQDLNKNEKEWLELVQLLAVSCHELGLANSMVLKRGLWIVGWMSLEQIA